jgi:hypothetical protein
METLKKEATPTPSKKNNYQDINEYLSDTSVALTNASDAEVAPLLANRGYSAAIIAAKVAEHATVKTLVSSQVKEYGDQYQATQNYNNAAIGLHPKYIEHIEIGRIVFVDDAAATTTLGLKGKRKRSASGYCSQAVLFYKAATENATYKAALAAKGVTDAELQTGKTGYANLSDLEAKQAKETGEAQGATAKRDKAIDDFAAWFSDFKKLGKIALSSKPQLREKLGWKE